VIHSSNSTFLSAIFGQVFISLFSVKFHIQVVSLAFHSAVWFLVPIFIPLFSVKFRMSNSYSECHFYSTTIAKNPKKISINSARFFLLEFCFTCKLTSGLWVVWGKKARTFRFSTNPSSHFFDLLFSIHKYIKCGRQIRQNPSI